MKRLVLLGGGHGNVEVLRTFHAHAKRAELTLVDPARFATYSGMLPGLVAGHYTESDCQIDLSALARYAGARFLQARARGIDPVLRKVVLDDGASIDYDLLSIDVGSTAAAAGIPGVAEHAIAVRPLATFLRSWEMLLARTRAGAPMRLAVVGGGAAGVELVLAMQHRLARLAPPAAVQLSLVTNGERLPSGHNALTCAFVRRLLARRGVGVHLHARATRLEPGAVVTANALRVVADAIVWAAGAGAPAWLRETGLAVDSAGFIQINEHLQSVSHADVFAAGDCATLVGNAHPKAGVYAVRQGPILAENLQLTLAGRPPVKYRPQRLALALISGGGKYAIASYGWLALAGAWAWRWKDRIDRRFVARYRVAD